MVKLRVICGGKKRDDSSEKKVRLFSAYSMVDNFKGHDCVRLNWIYRGRKLPVLEYEKLIDGYFQINERMRYYFEEYVKELFTEKESDLLRSYVSGIFGTEPTVVEEEVPLSCVFMPMPYGEIKPGGLRGFYKQEEAGDIGLPFSVCGYYDLGKCPPSIAIQSTAAEKGVEFLRESLRRMGILNGGEEPPFRDIVEQIYDEFGFFVDKGRNREERIKARAEFFKVNTPPKN